MKAVETIDVAAKNKEIVGKINDSFTEGNTDGFLSYCADDIEWTMIGDQTVIGKDAIREFMKSMEGAEPPVFNFDKTVAEGDQVVSTGDMKMKGKDGNVEPYSYCDIYTFTDGKISKLDSYVIKTATNQE